MIFLVVQALLKLAQFKQTQWILKKFKFLPELNHCFICYRGVAKVSWGYLIDFHSCLDCVLWALQGFLNFVPRIHGEALTCFLRVLQWYFNCEGVSLGLIWSVFEEHFKRASRVCSGCFWYISLLLQNSIF